MLPSLICQFIVWFFANLQSVMTLKIFCVFDYWLYKSCMYEIRTCLGWIVEHVSTHEDLILSTRKDYIFNECFHFAICEWNKWIILHCDHVSYCFFLFNRNKLHGHCVLLVFWIQLQFIVCSSNICRIITWWIIQNSINCPNRFWTSWN